MKKTLLLAAVFAVSYGFSQENLLLNGSGDLFTVTSDDATANGWVRNDSDNADAWDMTPNSTVIYDADAMVDGATTVSPYALSDDAPEGWSNSDLDEWLATFHGDDSEQPGSSSDGNFVDGVKTRGVKLNEAGRRLYQKVAVTAGSNYEFSLESRSEAEGVPSEVFILNTEIANEEGLSDASSTVDAYLEITNDFNSSKSNETENNFTTNTLEFTASGDFVVVYVRAPLAVDGDNEVFFDNLSLVEVANASSDDVLASKFAVYPNPASDVVSISSDVELTSVALYNALGAKVYASSNTSSLSVAGLAKGVYFLKVDSADSSATKKLIVE